MKTLTDMEMMKTTGGFKLSSLFKAASIVTFLIGIIDGYMRPLKCNS